jgi:hypothetical protein
MHIALTVILSQQEIVPQPSLIKLLASLLEGTVYCFVSYNVYITGCVLMNAAYKNFSDMDSDPDRIYQTGNICSCPDKNCNYCVITAYHTVRKVIFLFVKRQGKINCAYCHFNCLTTQIQSPNIYSNESNCACLKY